MSQSEEWYWRGGHAFICCILHNSALGCRAVKHGPSNYEEYESIRKVPLPIALLKARYGDTLLFVSIGDMACAVHDKAYEAVKWRASTAARKLYFSENICFCSPIGSSALHAEGMYIQHWPTCEGREIFLCCMVSGCFLWKRLLICKILFLIESSELQNNLCGVFELANLIFTPCHSVEETVPSIWKVGPGQRGIDRVWNSMMLMKHYAKSFKPVWKKQIHCQILYIQRSPAY